MLKKEDIIADMHMHTIVSKHAYSTIKENMDVARERGMKYIGITEHYYNDGTDIEKKNEIVRTVYANRINRLASDVKIISSFEFNLNQEWYDDDKIEMLKWRPVGIHSWFVDFDTLTLDGLYDLFVKSHEQHQTNVFVHIEREIHKIDGGKHKTLDEDVQNFYKKIVTYAKENNIFLEVNESSIVTNEGHGVSRMVYWLTLAKEAGITITMGSDAHYCNEVADFRHSIKMLNKIGYPKELIFNCNEEMILQYVE